MKAKLYDRERCADILHKTEIMRLAKIWLTVLNQEFGFGADRLKKAMDAVSRLSCKLYEDPEYWMRIDELLIDKYELTRYVSAEDLDEREIAAQQIHKKSGKKWRV